MITTRADEAVKVIAGTAFADIQVLKCDYTAVRTAARTNPCLYVMQKGTILGKWSYRRMGSVLSAVNRLP
jgi:hypothetical protein